MDLDSVPAYTLAMGNYYYFAIYKFTVSHPISRYSFGSSIQTQSI